MIVLDTNVLSEALRPSPDAAVLAWLEAQPAMALFTTSITRAEVFYGLCLLPKGRRRDQLHEAVTAIFDEDFGHRTLPFDDPAADAYAQVAAARRSMGRPISQFDAMIVGIARSRGAALATRNARDFEDCGVALINPWLA